jgi:N-acyl homoserine lactone hydrolase
VIDRLYRTIRRPLATALSENGLDRERVTAIVMSHLHFDHAGALREFPGIPIHVQHKEMEAARQPLYTILSRIDDCALRYVEHKGDAEITEGVRLIATPGHTPGHQSVAVETAEGLVVLACQAVYVLEEWADPLFEHAAGSLSAWDRDQYRHSLEKLRSLNPVGVRFTPDTRVWRAPGN